jgi:sirohydrochlorin cobaltochelatase
MPNSPSRSLRSLAALVLVIIGFAPMRFVAQTPARVGTIVIAHGGDSLWNAGVIEAAKSAQTGGPVEVSFLMGPGARTARFQDAVARLERAGATEIVVVPLLVSSHSGHYNQIRHLVGDSVALDETMMHHLHMSGIERANTRVPLRITPALDDAAELSQVLGDRALAALRTTGDAPAARALLLVGHGPNDAEDYAAWMSNLRVVAERVRVATGFRDVRVELVRDDAPAAVRAEAVTRTRELIEMQRAITGRDVIVVPVLVSKGAVSRDKLPADIRGTASIYLAEPLLPHAAMARWIESRVRGSRAAPAQSISSPTNH